MILFFEVTFLSMHTPYQNPESKQAKIRISAHYLRNTLQIKQLRA